MFYGTGKLYLKFTGKAGRKAWLKHALYHYRPEFMTMQNNNENKGGNAANSNKSSPKGAGSSLEQYSVQPKQQEEKSPYFKSAAPSIDMPKGGGALKGIDEKFTVNAVNGTAGLEISLPLTPGRGGFTPALSLSYNSGSGNSEFGLGWGLSLPAIQRKTDKKLPRYDDAAESDVFLLAGAEDLVPELDQNGTRVVLDLGNYRIKRYRPRIEGLFARIEYVEEVQKAGAFWRVTTKENTTTYYGLSSQSRIADPEEDSRIFKWLPELTVDHKGNVQHFLYIKENFDQVPLSVYETNRAKGLAPFTNTYLKSVRYGNLSPYFIAPEYTFAPVLPDTTWLFEALLDYGDHSDSNEDPVPDRPWTARTDAFSDFHAGFEIRTYRRCRRVLMFHRFKELRDGKPTLVRALELHYHNDELTAAATETDFITSAVQKGYKYRTDGTLTSKALPAMRMDYRPFSWNTAIAKVDPKDVTGMPQGLTGPYQWIDFEGEGISGILTEQGAGWFYKSNLSDGHFTPPKKIAEKPSFTGLGNALQWQDLDADGRRQVVTDAPAKGFWELDDNQQWQPFRTVGNELKIDWTSPFTKMLDLDGDGKADILVTEDLAWVWYANEGKKGYERGGSSPVFTDEEKGPVLLLRDNVQSIFLADMNGDGMTDLVRIRNGEVCYWPNSGYGKFGAKVTMGNSPVYATPDLFNPIYFTLADISGTGAADLIFTGNNRCQAWINLSGNAWSEAYEINPLPGTDAYSKIAVLDFLGNGTGCIVWSSPLPHHASAPVQYIDLMGGNKPYLMQRYYNGTGKIVEVTYKSSTKFYLADKLAGKPWATRLPFPVQCISEIITSDKVSSARFKQTYRYRHGYYDHEEREFRGFGYVETTDIDSAAISDTTELDQHPVQTRTWYHTGAWMREKTLLDQFKEEYFHFEGWDSVTAIATLPPGLNPQEQREAYRALKGSPLRQEVYVLDGSALQGVPYTVTATAYEVKQIQALQANRFACFQNLQQQSIVFNCERNPGDTRILHQLTLETDQYGNVLQSAEVAYKRKNIPATLPLKVQAEQSKMHITYTQNSFTNDVIDDAGYTHYRLRMPYRAKSFEALVNHADVTAGKLWTIAQLRQAIDLATEIDFSQTAHPGEKRLLSHTFSLFRANNAITKLAAGELDSLALPYESYQLAFSRGLIESCYADLDSNGDPVAGTSRVTDSMLEDFTSDDGGYVNLDSGDYFWLPSGIAYYNNPTARFYTPTSFTDPWGNETNVFYWGDYYLVPEQVIYPIGDSSARTVLAYDWRILSPQKLKDPNENITEVLHDALGMPVAMAVRGKGLDTEGDSLTGNDPEDTLDPDYMEPDTAADIANQAAFLDQPKAYADLLLKRATWRCVYDYSTLPVTAAMIARQQHWYNAVVVPDQGTERLIRFSYSDGLGRILMHKAQAEPDADTPLIPRWVGSGRTIYNNKGSAVMQYEPYFSGDHKCDTAEETSLRGVSPKIFYDALNRAYRTELPDGSFTKTEWTAWEQRQWDNNDTVMESTWFAARIDGAMGLSERDAARKAQEHAGTPTVMHTDTLARPFYTIQQDSRDHYIHSYVNLDIQGNRLSIVDGNRITPDPDNDPLTMSYRYNMLQAPCYQFSIDSDTQRTLLDVAGQPLYAWDADDRRFGMRFDSLRRVTEKWLNENVLLELSIYGEGQPDDSALNLRGQIYEHYDASGKKSFPKGYDFKGNPIVAVQQLLTDARLSDVDWKFNPPDLDTEEFAVSTLIDALGRPVQATDPGGNVTEYVYDLGGALKKVRLNNEDYVVDIHYDAKGQRESIWYGNKTKTGYTYDPFTFRLRRLLTVNRNPLSPGFNESLQDLKYYYDPVGNITEIGDEALQTLFYANTMIEPVQKYTYDALYRLIQAEGREQEAAAGFGSSDNVDDAGWKVPLGDDAAQRYIQKYTYDAVGNILRLQHISGPASSYTRDYTYEDDNNRLQSTLVDVVGTPYLYQHDNRGNITAMPHLKRMDWNSVNELRRITKGGKAEGSTWYQYSGGQRIRKYTEKGTIREERIYLGDFEIYRKFTGSSLTPDIQRDTIHISDDTGRIAMREVLNPNFGADDSEPELTRYIYSNHLGSASLELDETCRIITYEEYHPYGTTAYQAKNPDINAVAKRYRYTGKERDEESGLYYHGARYYIPWLCRWTACDPLESKYAGMSPYNYSFNNPVIFNDPSGMSGRKVGDNIEGYKEMGNGNKSLGLAIGMYAGQIEGTENTWGEISKTYNATLSRFEKSEDLKAVKLKYRAVTSEDLYNYSDQLAHGRAIATGTPYVAPSRDVFRFGKTLIWVNEVGASEPKLLGGTEPVNLDQIQSVSLEILINKRVDEQYSMMTLNHELSIHAVRLAELIKSANGDWGGMIERLQTESGDGHHQDMIDMGSVYNKINKEIIDYIDKLNPPERVKDVDPEHIDSGLLRRDPDFGIETIQIKSNAASNKFKDKLNFAVKSQFPAMVFPPPEGTVSNSTTTRRAAWDSGFWKYHRIWVNTR